MTEPLIDRAALDEVLDGHLMYRGKERIAAADAVIDYLRAVLTPKALRTDETFIDADGCRGIAILEGTDLHRRIFGEGR